MQILNKSKCQTEGCIHEAIGLVNGRFRCGECILRFEKRLKEEREKFFITEDANNN
jgi:ArsR family metal-binding transcriptional regulator